MKKTNIKFLILGIVVILLTVIAISPKEFQNDLFYTIKVGESIFNNGIDFVDHFSFHSNLPYTYPHYLFDLIVYIVYNKFNYTGLYILEILFTFILGMIIFQVNRKQTKNNVIPLLLSILTLFCLKPYITLRAQLLTFSIFALTYYYLERLYNYKDKKCIIGLIINIILINNLHIAVFPFFFIMFLPYIAEELVSYIKRLVNNKSKIIIKNNKYIKLLLLSIMICLIASLLTPLKLIPYSYLYNTLINDTMSQIQEHLPLVLKDNLVVLVFVFVSFALLFVRKSKITLHDLFMLLGLLFMAIMSSRQSSLLLLIGMFIFTKILCETIDSYRYDNELSMFLTGRVGILITLIFTFIIGINPLLINMNKDYVNEELYPTKGALFIKNNLNNEDIRIFNEYNFGSYLLLNDIKVFIDSRCDLYTYSYNKINDYFNDYTNVVTLSTYYEYVFNKYDITHVMLGNDLSLNQFLDNDINYSIIYRDNYFTIYQRNVKKTA